LLEINKLFTFECPCCKNRINAIKIIHPQVNNGCKNIKEKKCFYCPKCESKIGKPHSSKTNILFQAVLIFFVYFSINNLSEYFQFSALTTGVLYLVLFYILLIFFIKFYTFSCFKKEIKELQRDNFMEEYQPYQNIRMDNTEKRTIQTIYLVPILLIGITTFILLVFLFQ